MRVVRATPVNGGTRGRTAVYVEVEIRDGVFVPFVGLPLPLFPAETRAGTLCSSGGTPVARIAVPPCLGASGNEVAVKALALDLAICSDVADVRVMASGLFEVRAEPWPRKLPPQQ